MWFIRISGVVWASLWCGIAGSLVEHIWWSVVHRALERTSQAVWSSLNQSDLSDMVLWGLTPDKTGQSGGPGGSSWSDGSYGYEWSDGSSGSGESGWSSGSYGSGQSGWWPLEHAGSGVRILSSQNNHPYISYDLSVAFLADHIWADLRSKALGYSGSQ